VVQQVSRGFGQLVMSMNRIRYAKNKKKHDNSIECRQQNSANVIE